MADETKASAAPEPSSGGDRPSGSDRPSGADRPSGSGDRPSGGDRPDRPFGGDRPDRGGDRRGPRPGGPGGGREGGRKYFRRKKVCKFCVEKIEAINYKDVRLLAQFVAESGKIVPRRLTGVCTPHQRRLSTAIKQARNIALLPFAGRAS
ncbi:MAG: 30S ribosomal protein S18 [Acidobacteriia bacterium]|nr:30S ribosomal protein S18 [Terriglobia bacterium]